MYIHLFHPDCRTASRRRIAVPVLVAIATMVLFFVCPVAAHPPSEIGLSYDDVSQQLSVTITHSVPDPQDHYVRNVQVKVNDRVSSDVDYKSQPSTDPFTYTYLIPVNPGDTVRVTATCSLGPSLTKILEISSPAQPTAGQAAAPGGIQVTVPTQKSAIGLLPFIGIAAVLLFRRKK